MKLRPEDMSDHELLMELVAEKRREDRRRKTRLVLRLILLAALLALALWLVPKLVAAFQSINTALHSVQASSPQVGTGAAWRDPALDGLLEGVADWLRK